MKILHLIPTMTGGGAEKQCIKLVRELTNAGHDVCVMLLRGGDNFQELLETGAEVVNLNTRSNYSPRTWFRLWREIRRRKPDVVQSWLAMMDTLAGMLRLVTRFCWVMTERNRLRSSPTLKQLLRRRLARRADALIANSPLACKAWQDTLHPDRCHCILNIVDVQAILADREVPASPIPQASRLVACAGRLLDEQKNVVQLLKAFMRVVRMFPDVGAMFLGDGPDRDRLETMVRDEGLSDRIVFLGFVERPWRYLNMASVVALVSRYEGQPNVLLEAMALKKPLVLSDIPEHRETLSADGHAIWVDKDCIDSIDRGIQKALRTSSDREFDRNSDIVMANHDPRSIAEQYLEVYRAIQSR